MGIFNTNRMEVCNVPELGKSESALYQDISRINHSCAPNCVWSWNKENLARKEVRACREINKGEEIVASYINFETVLSREERMNDLENWDFLCQCQVCSKTGKELEKNEKVRLQIKKLHNEIREHLFRGKVKEALMRARKKLDLMETIKNETALWKPDALRMCYELSVKMLSLRSFSTKDPKT